MDKATSPSPLLADPALVEAMTSLLRKKVVINATPEAARMVLACPALTARIEAAVERAYLDGFMASGEGYNGEYPYGDRNQKPEDDPYWITQRDKTIRDRGRKA